MSKAPSSWPLAAAATLCALWTVAGFTTVIPPRVPWAFSLPFYLSVASAGVALGAIGVFSRGTRAARILAGIAAAVCLNPASIGIANLALYFAGVRSS